MSVMVTPRDRYRLPVRWTAVVLAVLSISSSACSEVADSGEPVTVVVDRAVRQVVGESDIPGISVAVITGDRTRLFHYGGVSKDSGRAVDDGTVFEIGSVSKTPSATLGVYAESIGAVSLSAPAADHVPALRGSRFDDMIIHVVMQ